MSLIDFDAKIDQWVASILSSPSNLATEIELREQSKVALKLFIDADADRSQTLSFEELKMLCNTAGLPVEDDEEDAMAHMDKDASGCLDIGEWVVWWLQRVSSLPNPIKQQEAIARNTFTKFDVDNSGCLDASELGQLTAALGAEFSPSELQEALSEIDADGGGMIEIEEFLLWWTNRAASNRNNSSLISLKMRKLAMKAAQVFSTDIFTATWNGDVGLIRAFIDGERRLARAADTSEYGEGWTALHYACYRGHAEIVDILVRAGADINATNDAGFTPLFYAAQRSHLDVCKALLSEGADPTIAGLEVLSVDENGNILEEIFLSAVDHMVDTPELRTIFQSNTKCVMPLIISSEKIEAALNLKSCSLKFELLTAQKHISHLPIKYWNMQLRMDMQMDAEGVSPDVYGNIVESGLSFEQELPAVYFKKAQTYTTVIPKEWAKKLYFLSALHRMKSIQLLRVSAVGLQKLSERLFGIYNQIDIKYRKTIRLLDILMLILRKCTDKREAKMLRNSLREVLKQVDLKEANDVPEAPPSEPGVFDTVQLQQAIEQLCIDESARLANCNSDQKSQDVVEAGGDDDGGHVWEFGPSTFAPPAVEMRLSATNSWGTGPLSNVVAVPIDNQGSF